jgi:hypothetical protein
MHDVAIISTSINERPEAYEAWAAQGDLIVAGDISSPPALEDYVKAIGGRYLTPEYQKVWNFSGIIGWKSVQRRNLAVMDAYAERYRYVVTVDDDNTPDSEEWVSEHRNRIDGIFPDETYNVYGDGAWINIGDFVEPRVHQRGTPYGVVSKYESFFTARKPPIIVSQAQVLGEPDCDAVSRIADHKFVESVKQNIVFLPAAAWAAFNSQATMWRGDWAPFIACLPFVQRYDDIWAAFIAERVLQDYRYGIYVGEPCVRQDRNEHDLVVDLKNELYGMQHTPYVIRALRNISEDLSEVPLYEAYHRCTLALRNEGVLPGATYMFMLNWAKAWEKYSWKHDV